MAGQQQEWQPPSVGRMVHYVSYGTPGGEYASECRAAVVASVLDDASTCRLVVFNPEGIYFNTVPYSEEKKGGTWHWPERV